jgi:hypothetical protein
MGHQGHSSEVPGLSDEQIRGFLKAHANIKGSRLKENLVKGLKIKGISNIPTYIYRLETYVEHRTGSWVTVPYAGQEDKDKTSDEHPDLDEPPANFWDFTPTPPIPHFENGQQTYVLPDSATIYTCPDCGGCGEMDCDECHGELKARCKKCNGTGHTGVLKMKAVCIQCKRGKIDCPECDGTGQINCDYCHGHGLVTSAYEMDVQWQKMEETPVIIVNGQLGPKYNEMLANIKVKELKVNEAIAARCSSSPEPFQGKDFADLAVQKTSKEKLQQIAQKDLDEGSRIIEYRQSVHRVKSTLINFTCKGKEGEFIIYGPQNLLFFPNAYPKNSSCSLL